MFLIIESILLADLAASDSPANTLLIKSELAALYRQNSAPAPAPQVRARGFAKQLGF